MSWARLDDAILDNQKVVEVGALGFALHVAAVTWAARNLSDGFIPGNKAWTLLDFRDITSEYGFCHQAFDDDTAATLGLGFRVVANLLDADLWEKVDGGYLLHDYLDYNPTKAEVLARRAQKQAAGAAGGQASAAARAQASTQASAQAEPVANRVANKVAESKPVPVPVPVPILGTSVTDVTVVKKERDTPARRVWAAYVEAWGGSAKFETWRDLINRTLKNNDESYVVDAIVGSKLDPWPDRPLFHSLKFLLKPENMESFVGFVRNGVPVPGAATAAGRAIERSVAADIQAIEEGYEQRRLAS